MFLLDALSAKGKGLFFYLSQFRKVFVLSQLSDTTQQSSQMTKARVFKHLVGQYLSLACHQSMATAF